MAQLCQVKPYVLRYWEQEFTQLKPMKRRGNRRYYQHHEVLLIRRICDLLYEQGFTISGARQQLGDAAASERRNGHVGAHDDALANGADHGLDEQAQSMPLPEVTELTPGQIRAELLALRELLRD